MLTKATTFWITGLSGAGKTTLLPHLINHIKTLTDIPIIKFDGDDLRSIININSYDRSSRVETALVYSRLCNSLNNQGFHVVIGCIGMYSKIYEWNKNNIKSFCDVFLDVPIHELENRDPKGIYKNAKIAKNSNVAGIDFQIDIPSNPKVYYKWKEGDQPIDMISFCQNKLDAFLKI